MGLPNDTSSLVEKVEGRENSNTHCLIQLEIVIKVFSGVEPLFLYAMKKGEDWVEIKSSAREWAREHYYSDAFE